MQNIIFFPDTYLVGRQDMSIEVNNFAEASHSLENALSNDSLFGDHSLTDNSLLDNTSPDQSQSYEYFKGSNFTVEASEAFNIAEAQSIQKLNAYTVLSKVKNAIAVSANADKILNAASIDIGSIESKLV